MISIDLDTRAVERAFDNVASKQLPFALALGINDTLGEVKDAAPGWLDRDLDRPTPFTRRGLFVSRASKRKLYGVVGLKDRQADYLEAQASGGRRKAKRRAVVVPVGIRLNKYGNMPRSKIKKTIARPDVFSGTVNGVAGIWQRPKRGARRTKANGARSGRVATVGKQKGLKLLAIYKSSVKYKPRLKFAPRGAELAQRKIALNVSRRFKLAVKTAR
jgi:hypothetical protein